MVCVSPLLIPSLEKKGINFPLPCGHCSLCKKRRLNDWFIRNLFEAQYHHKKCIVTLTYDEEHLPDDGKLCVRDTQLFFKRLRKNSNVKIRYFLVGEYGSKFRRPHYHAVLYGLGIDDKDLILKTWKNGFIKVDFFKLKALKYLMKYFLKSQYLNGELFKTDDEKIFFKVSKRPGFGFQFFQDNYDQLVNDGFFMYCGKKYYLPRYFLKKIQDELVLEVLREGSLKRFSDFEDEISLRTGKKGIPLYNYIKDLLKQIDNDNTKYSNLKGKNYG